MLVSVVIPAREWDGRLEETLTTIDHQALPPDTSVETIVGLANDAPSSIPDGVRVVHNPSGTIPDALNRAVAASSGEIVIRVDARCDLQRDHIRRVVERLEDPTIGCVGGAALVLDRGVFGSAYAVAFNSPLLGPSRYRYSATSGPVDTAYLGSWRRAELEQLGGFDTRLIRNQDNELADRVRASGRTVWYDAGLVVGYFNGRGLRGSMQHHHDFGLWRMRQAAQGQQGLNARHLAALSAASAAAALGVVSVLHPTTRRAAAVAGFASYGAVALGAFRSASRLRSKRRDITGPAFNPAGVALAPLVAVALDAAWVAGIVRGVINRKSTSLRRHVVQEGVVRERVPPVTPLNPSGQDRSAAGHPTLTDVARPSSTRVPGDRQEGPTTT